MHYKGDDIKRLIPQREPFVMVNEFEQRDSSSAAVTSLTVHADNYFMLPDGTLAETGLIEHIAQSASALASFTQQGVGRPPIGLIGEVKHFTCHRRPLSGDRIETTIVFGFTFGNATIVTGTCRISGEVVAEATMKIFIQ